MVLQEVQELVKLQMFIRSFSEQHKSIVAPGMTVRVSR